MKSVLNNLMHSENNAKKSKKIHNNKNKKAQLLKHPASKPTKSLYLNQQNQLQSLRLICS